MKKIIYLLASILIFTNLFLITNANQIETNNKPCADKKEFIQMIDSRLNLTDEQKEILKKNRQKNKKEIRKILNKMEKLTKEIKSIYLSSNSKLEADIKSSTKKMQLVLLKQEADNLRKKHREEFEKILTQDQKTEFEKIKNEFKSKNSKKID